MTVSPTLATELQYHYINSTVTEMSSEWAADLASRRVRSRRTASVSQAAHVVGTSELTTNTRRLTPAARREDDRRTALALADFQISHHAAYTVNSMSVVFLH